MLRQMLVFPYSKKIQPAFLHQPVYYSSSKAYLFLPTLLQSEIPNSPESDEEQLHLFSLITKRDGFKFQ